VPLIASRTAQIPCGPGGQPDFCFSNIVYWGWKIYTYKAQEGPFSFAMDDLTASDYVNYPRGGASKGAGNEVQPLSKGEEAMLVVACLAGMNSEYAKPVDLNPPDPSDITESTDNTNGQSSPNIPNKKGDFVPSGGSPEVPRGVADGVAQGAGIAQCVYNVFNAWPE
jgi:hypothetical protein